MFTRYDGRIRGWQGAVIALLLGCLSAAVAVADEPKPEQTKTKATSQEAAQSPDDEAAIRATVAQYEKAFAAGDAAALAAQWAKDGELVDSLGRSFKGRESIEQEYGDIFADRPGATVKVDVQSLRFVSPDVAVETGTARAKAKDGSVGEPVQYTAVHVKHDGKWQLANVTETRSSLPDTKTQLADLSWLVGEWKADLGDGKNYHLRCEWMTDKTFLRREFSVKQGNEDLSSGTQIVGWDPVLGQIVSWTFDSSGGFGHELWEDQGARWRVAASSVLANGATSLSTNYLTKANDNAFTWQSVERSLNDELLPDTAQVSVERISQ